MSESDPFGSPDGVFSGNAGRPRQRRTQTTLDQMLNAPVQRRTPLGNDTAWALKLKECVVAAVRELHVEVLSAKPVECFDSGVEENRDMAFELETNRGLLHAVRLRNGRFDFYWGE